MAKRYRPLAGISCNRKALLVIALAFGYRPLAGISCNGLGVGLYLVTEVPVPLRG